MGNLASKNTIIDIVDNAAKVSVNGAITAVTGTTKLYTLNAEAAAGSGDAAGEFISDSTGFKGFTVDIVDDVAIAADESLMVCWSTSADDETSTTTELDALRTDIGTPDGTAHTNCFIVTANTKEIPIVVWDGTNTIKTISVAAQAQAKDVVVMVVA